MKTLITDPKRAALTSFLLALPFTSLFLVFILGLEPSLAFLEPYLKPDESHIGSYIVFAALLLLLAAFVINLRLILRDVRSGSGISAHPVNLVLCAISLSLMLLFAGGIIVDQYPCWIGVPNCD